MLRHRVGIATKALRSQFLQLQASASPQKEAGKRATGSQLPQLKAKLMTATLIPAGLESCKTLVSGRAGEAPVNLPRRLAGLAFFISGFFILIFLLNNSSL